MQKKCFMTKSYKTFLNYSGGQLWPILVLNNYKKNTETFGFKITKHVAKKSLIMFEGHLGIGADGLSRKAIRNGGLWKFLNVCQIYPLSNQR